MKIMKCLILGRIRSISRRDDFSGSRKSFVGKVLTPQPDEYGYLYINIYNNKKRKRYALHRLIASTFLGLPPTQLHTVNHKNLIKYDNRVENLEWMTRLENMDHASQNKKGWGKGVFSEKHKEVMKKQRKKVLAVSDKTGQRLEFNSHLECANYFGVKYHSISSYICLGSKVRKEYALSHNL